MPLWSLRVTQMETPERTYPRLKEIKFGRHKDDPATVALTVSDNQNGEYRVGIEADDAGHLIGGMIASIGQALDVGGFTAGKVELSSTKVIVANARIGFGDTAKGPVVVAQVGGLTLVFTISESDLVEMAQEILESYDEASPRHLPSQRH